MITIISYLKSNKKLVASVIGLLSGLAVIIHGTDLGIGSLLQSILNGLTPVTPGDTTHVVPFCAIGAIACVGRGGRRFFFSEDRLASSILTRLRAFCKSNGITATEDVYGVAFARIKKNIAELLPFGYSVADVKTLVMLNFHSFLQLPTKTDMVDKVMGRIIIRPAGIKG
jgi:hypothetical protein